ncbi:U-scoloptoxin(01)-Cw1a-like [Onthophagus taurus]|uniref:U-scoloptoxin(01)-Cw1a-like n=1 Tax=Onthophagus taurus TaxID=166361 RepID=UPI0039BDF1D2
MESYLSLGFLIIAFLISGSYSGYYIIPGQMPYDGYHDLHLPHDPPLYPTLRKVPKTSFSCESRSAGYYADIEAACQAYHVCNDKKKIVASFLCTNGTLFNEQFQVCDQFYNVRCGSKYLDLF